MRRTYTAPRSSVNARVPMPVPVPESPVPHEEQEIGLMGPRHVATVAAFGVADEERV